MVTHTRVISCTDPAVCSDEFLTRLDHNAATFALKAANPTDVVHGSITIAHAQPPAAHTVIVEIYETAEAPNGSHDTDFQVTSPMPTESDITTKLDLP